MMIKNARLSFPHLYRAHAFNPGQTPKFSATLIFDADGATAEAVKAEIKAVAEAKWGAKAPEVLKALNAQNKLCLRSSEEKADLEGFEDGTLFINASSTKRPGTFNRDRSPLAEDDNKLYPGCYVNAAVEIWAQDNQYGRRINAELKGVQFAEDGEPLGGGGAPATADDFPELEPASASSDDDWM